MKQTIDIHISPEYLAKIRSFTAIQPEEVFNYTPLAYRSLPSELHPKFKLSPVTGEEILRFSDDMRGEVLVDGGKAEVRIKHGEFVISVVKKGLKEWENYYTSDGKIIPYDSNIGNLPRELLEELCEACTSRSKLTSEELLGLK